MTRRVAILSAATALLCVIQAAISVDSAKSVKATQSLSGLVISRPLHAIAAEIGASDSALIELKGFIQAKYANSSKSCVQLSVGGNVVYEKDPDEALVPASGIKLIVASVALDVFGVDARFKTEIKGEVTGGDVKNLYVRGGGDPLMTTDTYAAKAELDSHFRSSLQSLVSELKSSGVETISGPITVDDTRYDDQRAISSWSSSYIPVTVAPIGALVINDNHRDDLTAVSTDPAVFFGNLLTNELRSQGISVAGAVTRGVTPGSSKTIVSFDSALLGDLVTEMLSNSNNTTAEMLIKEIGFAKSRAGTTEAGLAFIKQWLASKALPMNGYVQADGSGLSTTDEVSCRLLRELIDMNVGNLRGRLSVAGVSGTLRDRVTGKATNVVHAKTGTLKNAASLAGFLAIDKGPYVSFAAIDNHIASNAEAHAWQNDIANAIATFSTTYTANLGMK